MPSPYYERQKAELKTAMRSRDYSGHIPQSSPIQSVVNEMMRKSNEAREKILMDLIENPGVVATFGEDFVVEFEDVEIKHDPNNGRELNEYVISLVQRWRIRRREESDGKPERDNQETTGLYILP